MLLPLHDEDCCDVHDSGDGDHGDTRDDADSDDDTTQVRDKRHDADDDYDDGDVRKDRCCCYSGPGCGTGTTCFCCHDCTLIGSLREGGSRGEGTRDP